MSARGVARGRALGFCSSLFSDSQFSTYRYRTSTVRVRQSDDKTSHHDSLSAMQQSTGQPAAAV